jgi:APA family basic amino acid/polyamine antiporter
MEPKLKRSVNLFTLIMYGIGIILGAGIYAIIGKAAGMAGNSLWMAFLIAALVGLLTGLSYMELISMFPQTAAEYIYVKNSVQSKSIAFIAGWMMLVAGIVSASTVAIGFANYFSELIGGQTVLVAIVLLIVLSAVNLWGISESTKLNVVFTLIEITGLAIVIFAAVPNLGTVDLLAMPNGLFGVISGSALIFFAFTGFESIANVAEETKNPQKTAPRALLAAITITTIIYILTSISIVNLASPEQLASSSAPLSFAVSQVFGPSAFTLMSVIALFATANTVLIILIATSRIMYGLSKEGAIPKLFSRLLSRRRTPWTAILAIALFAGIFVLFENIEIIAGIADFSLFIVYGFVNASLIILRYKQPTAQRKFRVPLNIGRFPLLPLLGLIVTGLLAANLDFSIILVGTGIILVAFPIYYLLRKAAKLRV